MYRSSFTQSPLRMLASGRSPSPPRCYCLNEIASTKPNTSIPAGAYMANAEVESLPRYRPGGYHPIHLGDLLYDGKYRIVHKLGFGGYSTVWLAHDLGVSRLVALKILVAELGQETQEIKILRYLSGLSPSLKRELYLSQLRGSFRHSGPNGSHQCLVFDVDGVSVQALAQSYGTERLPRKMAWEVSKQLLLALEVLHSNGVTHADLHPGNIMVSAGQGQYSDPAILRDLKPPYQATVEASPGYRLTSNMPQYVVEPVDLPAIPRNRKYHVKLIDFGQAFLHGQQPSETRTPLIFRAPEILMGSELDYSIDIWAAACSIFEIFTGQPPFDNIMPDRDSLIHEWIAFFGDLPPEWKRKLNVKGKSEMEPMRIGDWLHMRYFDGERSPDFAEEHLEWLGDLLEKMMRYRPGARLSVKEVLRHRLFDRNPFE